MKLEMKQRMEQADYKALTDRARAFNCGKSHGGGPCGACVLKNRLANAIDALLAERDSALDDHARRYNEMLVSAQENQRLRAERDAHHSERERDLSNFTKTIDALRAEREVLQANLKGWHDASDAQTDNNTLLRDKLAKATEALEMLHGKAQAGLTAYPDSMKGCWSEVMFGTIRDTARAALDKIKETTNAR